MTRWGRAGAQGQLHIHPQTRLGRACRASALAFSPQDPRAWGVRRGFVRAHLPHEMGVLGGQ